MAGEWTPRNRILTTLTTLTPGAVNRVSLPIAVLPEYSFASGEYCVHLLQDIDELRFAAELWDDLWFRSATGAPSARAELIAQWLEHFSQNKRFCAVVVEQAGKFLAALPLVSHRVLGLIESAGLPSNGWSVSGDLLLDESTHIDAVLDQLVEATKRLGWPALWLDQVPFEELRWQKFKAALTRAGVPHCIREHYRVGQVGISEDWKSYEGKLNGDHRRNRNRYFRMLEKAGRTELRVHSGLKPAEVAALLQTGFEIEDRSWKSANGTSVLKTPGMFEVYCCQAQQLAEWGQLELVFLHHNDTPIAFDYGWRSKSTHFLCKLGYDDAYRQYGPGQQMIHRLLQRFHEDGEHRLLDFWGPMVPWNESWSTTSYPVGRLVAQLSPIVGRGLFQAYSQWQPKLRQAKDRWKHKRHMAEG